MVRWFFNSWHGNIVMKVLSCGYDLHCLSLKIIIQKFHVSFLLSYSVILLHSCMVSLFYFCRPKNTSLFIIKGLVEGEVVASIHWKFGWCPKVLLRWFSFSRQVKREHSCFVKADFCLLFCFILAHLKEWIKCKRLLCMVLHGCIRVSGWIWRKLWSILRRYEWSKLKEATEALCWMVL